MNITTTPVWEEASTFALRTVIGLTAGALIGVERERARISELSGKELPGIRSFSLLGLFGSISAYASATLEYSIVVSSLFIASFVVLLLTYMFYRTFILKRGGITTYIVMAIAYLLGFVAGIGGLIEAISASILTALILAAKIPLESMIGRVSYEELLSAFELGLIVFILGPMVYTSGIEFGGVSLWGLYIFFTLVLAISFGSYVAVKLKGAEGLRYLALLGGLVNSEATLISIAEVYSSRLSEKEAKRDLMVATILTNTAMTLRNAVLAAAAAQVFLESGEAGRLLIYIAPGLLIPGLVGLIVFSLYREKTSGEVSVSSPLNFEAALKAVAVYGALIFLAWALKGLLGSQSIILLSLIGGVVNAGATILSIFTVYSVSSVKLIASGVLLATATAAMNKALYIRTVPVHGKIYTNIILWCLYMALPPLIFGSLIVTGMI